jgi:FMN reductase
MRRADIEPRNASLAGARRAPIVKACIDLGARVSTVLSLLGSPSIRSRSAALLGELERRLAAGPGGPRGVARLTLRELPAEALLRADAAERAIAAAVGAVAEAQLLLVATPIYKAAYSGLLKSFLDLLPQDALRGKTVVPLATGGSAAHLLALDYALKPVLAALGARDIRDAVYASDAQLPPEAGGHVPVAELRERLDQVAADLLQPRPLPRWLWPAASREAASNREAATPLAPRCPA